MSLPKRPGLLNEDINCLLFSSKTLEKEVSRCAEDLIETSQLHDSCQSAYQGRYSTETSLFSVHCDIAKILHEESTIVSCNNNAYYAELIKYTI